MNPHTGIQTLAHANAHMHTDTTQHISKMILQFGIMVKRCPLFHLSGNSKTTSTGSFVFP